MEKSHWPLVDDSRGVFAVDEVWLGASCQVQECGHNRARNDRPDYVVFGYDQRK